MRRAIAPNEHVTENTVRRGLADGVPWDDINRRIEADRITATELREWFNGMPGSTANLLTDDALHKLARDIAHLRETVWPHALSEKRAKRLRRIEAAGEELAAAIQSWLELQPTEPDSDENSGHQFARLARSLLACGFVGIDCPPKATPRPRGQPRALWHKWGREFAALLKRALTEAGYAGGVAETDEHSVIAVVGAEVITRAFGHPINPSGFATAMRQRDRSAKGRIAKQQSSRSSL